jgi:phage terminase small subunit
VGLKPKRLAFAREFLKDRNATQAAIRAGYSPKTAGVQGHALLKIPEVAEYIAKHTERAAEEAEITAAEVLQGLKREADGNGPDTNASSRVAALTALGKHLAMFTERSEVSGNLVIEVVSLAGEE